MGKRYYCDYCDRSFKDDLGARKKHLNGTLHIRTRKSYYKQYQDLKTIVNENCAKEECRRFRTTGECQFGEHCNFTHYSKQELNKMKQQVEDEEIKKQSFPAIASASVEQWLEVKLNKSKVFPLLPQKLYLTPDLPPSLQPPTEEDLNSIEFNEWG
uniref:C3H1-type domain-containing protein n=1 Tax=Clastoptera arizonana TaxID=38151 RepID=A0A1B6CSJ5_9HEMI